MIAESPFVRLASGFAAVLILTVGCGESPSPQSGDPAESPLSKAQVNADEEPATSGSKTTPARSSTGRFRRRPTAEAELVDDEDPLNMIGYAAGSQPAPALSGVTRHVSALSHEGLNFVISGHAPGAELVNMKGEVLHRWEAKFHDIWPDYETDVSGQPTSGFWRRAHLFENGDVLVVFESFGFARLDRDSNVLWSQLTPVHHDLQIMDDGNLYILGRNVVREEEAKPGVKRLLTIRKENRRQRKQNADFDDDESRGPLSHLQTILEDYVLIYSPGPTLESRLSLFRCFQNSKQEHSWLDAAKKFWKKENQRTFNATHRDIFHTNSLRVLDGRISERVPEFAEGNYLVSMRHLDMIAVIDPVEEKVVWSMTGASALQHDAQITSDGHLLYFDNQWQLERSRVAMVDPLTREVVWEYGTKPGQDLYSQTCGTVQELPNKNILINETDAGRSLEVTRDGKIVWEFYNPHVVGGDAELIGSLFDVVRLGPDFPTDWFQ